MNGVESVPSLRSETLRAQRVSAAASNVTPQLQSWMTLGIRWIAAADDLRRVNALLVAHAEEHQRDVARIRDLETSSSAAEAARISAQADRDSAQASVLPIASRAAIFRSALLDARRSATQRREQTQERVRHLPARAAGLENALALSQQASQAEIARLGGLIDQSDLAYTERTMSWRRLLPEARAGRESARLVRDALVTRLSDMVTAVGGSVDVTQLVRSFESRVEASTYAATPLPPDLDPEIGRAAATLSGLLEVVVGLNAYAAAVVLRRLQTPLRRTARLPSSPAADSSLGPLSRATSPASSGADSDARPPARQRRRLTPPSSDPVSDSTEGSAHSRASGGGPVRSSGGRLFSSDSDSDNGAPNGGPAGFPPTGGVAPAVRPFFTPVIPPFQHRAEWTRSRYAPWARALRDLTLSYLTARALRVEHLPPRAWIFPTTSSPVPAFWDPTLLTERMVEDFYATRPWDYLTRRAQPLTFDIHDTHFQSFVARYEMHLDHWAQAYWESTHEFPVPNT
ncbi:hypothetical protein PHMEG_00034882, partial [Phytophthora megakarya]